ncbi:MAG: cytochrome c3 family protein, partial [Longimicrobiales bacterium]
MLRPSMKACYLALAAILAIALGACTDEKIVFQDRELFETPEAAALGFLGYSNQEDKLTVCGNCHVGTQAQWEETAHADAWADLQDTGRAQDFCSGCHAVSELGNPVEGAAGYNAVPDERYTDAQCESCHGPGLSHVENPDASQPAAGISVGVDLATGCGECHSGTHNPFVEDWSQSAHANVGFQAAREGCTNCHSGSGALAAWGVEAEYLEKEAALAGEAVPITCAVCHDPHGSENAAQLRFPINTPEVGVNLCSKCHDRRTEPDPGSSYGLKPHAPESALLEGDVGWFPPGATIDRGAIISTHGSEANPSLCATCHVNSFEITDPATGDFVFSATGHVFDAIPCLDDQGIPTAE